MSLALLFPGQGVQNKTMLSWLDDDPGAASVLAAMAAEIGTDWRAHLDDAAWAESNRVAQCLITGTSLAAWAALQRAGVPAPQVIAGYSVGELAGFSAAGVFDARAAMTLAVRRAAAMDRAAAGQAAGLLSVAGLPAADIERTARDLKLEIAIALGAARCLIGGESSALDAAASLFARHGAEVVRLRIGVASHTGRMNAAAAEFGELVASQNWRSPQVLLICNRSGSAVRRVPDLKRCLAEQIDHTVQWQRSMETLAERRPRCVLEVGPGTALSRLWLETSPQIPARSVDEFGSAASAAAWVRERLAC